MNLMAVPPTEDISYIDEITSMLRGLLRQVIKAREPEVLPILDDAAAAQNIPPHLVEHALQVIGIWLQLMNIAEENAAIRNRRDVEKQAGPDEVGGSLSQSLAEAAASGVSGPTTTSSTACRWQKSITAAWSAISSATHSASRAMPALPGAQ